MLRSLIIILLLSAFGLDNGAYAQVSRTREEVRALLDSNPNRTVTEEVIFHRNGAIAQRYECIYLEGAGPYDMVPQNRGVVYDKRGNVDYINYYDELGFPRDSTVAYHKGGAIRYIKHHLEIGAMWSSEKEINVDLSKAWQRIEFFDKKGELTSVEEYKYGSRHGPWYEYKNKAIVKEIHYKDGTETKSLAH